MSRLKSLWTLFAVLAFAAPAALAQNGSITGTVADPSGAVIANATITATASATGISRTAVTSSAGVYNFAALPPAHYNISATAQGFQDATYNDVILTVAQTLPLNITLAVGNVSTTVDVGAETSSAVETQSFSLSTVVDSKQINDLPLILRDPYQLILLSPGVVMSTNDMGGFSVNGQRDRNNNFLLDGADNNDTSVPGIPGGLSSANPDSAQEFRVITNNFDAEFGRNTGGIVDVITRGGTNRFHGDAYEFGRYSALGARDWFNRKTDGPQDPYVRNDFGASLGGPIWKDNTFFFLNGEVQRFRTTRTAVATVPTAAYKSGRFTYISPIDGSQTPVDLTNPANPDNYSHLGLDPTVQKILALSPAPTVDNGDGVSGNYFFASPDPLNSYSLTGRFDHKLTDKHQLTVRYQYGHLADKDPFHDEVLPGYGNTSTLQTTHNGVISLASTLSPNTTNQFRAGYNQSSSGFFCNHDGFDAATGVDSFGNGRDISLPGFFTFGCASLVANGQARLSSTLLFADTVSKTKGAHTLKFGGEYRSVKDTSYDDFYSREQLDLSLGSTFQSASYKYNGNQDPNVGAAPAFWDLVYGAQGAIANEFEYQFFTANGTRRADDLTRFRQHEWAVFAQDSWKVLPRLTVIAGLRYEFNGVPYENDANFSNLYTDPSQAVPSVGYFTFTRVGPGTHRQLYKDSWGLVEPRLGFAIDPFGDGKTAIRGGYGIFHDRLFDNLFGNARSNPPFQATLNNYPYLDTAPNFPVVSSTPAPGSLTPSPNVFPGDLNRPVIIDANLKMPGNQTWNLGIQHQFARDLSVELNYVGSHGTHILREVNANPPQPALVQNLLNQGVSPGLLQTTNLYTGVTLADGTVVPPAVNNNAFSRVLLQTSIASSNYNALQAKFTKRFGGLYLNGSYSYAHSLDNGTDALAPGAGGTGLPVNPFDINQEYGNSDFDIRHRASVAAIYELPVGHGKQFLSTGILGRIFEGIQISGVQQAQTGSAFDLRGTIDNQHTGQISRPDLVGNPYPSNRSASAAGKVTGPAQSAFANAPFGVTPNIRRNKFHGPNYVNTDAVFQKTQSITEGVKLVLRAESYNVLNHPNFTNPASADLGLSSPNFGVSTSQVGQNDGTTGARQLQGAIKVVF